MARQNVGFGGVNLHGGTPGAEGERGEPMPFRMLLCGDFRGDAAPTPWTARKPIAVDRDDFDAVLAKLAPRVRIALAGGGDVELSFQSLDDFEPDALLARVPIFDELRELRDALEDPRQFDRAASIVRGWMPAEAQAEPTRRPSADDAIASILGDDFPRAASRPNVGDDWARFVDSVVAKNLAPEADPRKDDYVAVVEEAIAVRLRAILHHPSFQALESAWRSLFLVVRRLPTDENLRLFLFDAKPSDWARDLGGDLEASVFFREVVLRPVVERSVDPFAAVVLFEEIGPNDLVRLGKMAALSATAQTTLLAGASPRLAGCDGLVREPDPRVWATSRELDATWQTLRSLPDAAYVGLALPRILLRLPYGKGAASIDAFAFEELAPDGPHEHCLWGPASAGLAVLLGEAFAESSWRLDSDDRRRLAGLPVYVTTRDGERFTQPCAETLLRENALERLTDRGLIVFVSDRERDSATLPRWQSIAGSRLAGRWS